MMPIGAISELHLQQSTSRISRALALQSQLELMSGAVQSIADCVSHSQPTLPQNADAGFASRTEQKVSPTLGLLALPPPPPLKPRIAVGAVVGDTDGAAAHSAAMQAREWSTQYAMTP